MFEREKSRKKIKHLDSLVEKYEEEIDTLNIKLKEKDKKIKNLEDEIVQLKASDSLKQLENQLQQLSLADDFNSKIKYCLIEYVVKSHLRDLVRRAERKVHDNDRKVLEDDIARLKAENLPDLQNKIQELSRLNCFTFLTSERYLSSFELYNKTNVIKDDLNGLGRIKDDYNSLVHLPCSDFRPAIQHGSLLDNRVKSLSNQFIEISKFVGDFNQYDDDISSKTTSFHNRIQDFLDEMEFSEANGKAYKLLEETLQTNKSNRNEKKRSNPTLNSTGSSRSAPKSGKKSKKF